MRECTKIYYEARQTRLKRLAIARVIAPRFRMAVRTGVNPIDCKTPKCPCHPAKRPSASEIAHLHESNPYLRVAAVWVSRPLTP